MHRDRALQYTSVGPHRDDLEFVLQGHSLKKFASQGQQKTYLLALKLAQFEFIKERIGILNLDFWKYILRGKGYRIKIRVIKYHSPDFYLNTKK